eukprot:1057895-Rhodomonas_salina.2
MAMLHARRCKHGVHASTRRVRVKRSSIDSVVEIFCSLQPVTFVFVVLSAGQRRPETAGSVARARAVLVDCAHGELHRET